MKRCAELRDLSEDHHHGLVLARRARRAAAGVGERSVAAQWRDVAETFERDLEPHLQIEERHLAPALEALGGVELASRLRREHAALRALVAPSAARGAAELREFGELLERHIRFEERELFQWAQERMDTASLAAVEHASREQRERGGGSACRSLRDD